MECPKCKSEIDNDSRFCDQCGLELRFCSLCGRPGKGNRCTFCGGVMIGAEEHFVNPAGRTVVTSEERTIATAVTMATKRGIPHLFLVNNSMQIRMAGIDGGVLGRRNGNYQSYLSNCSYISGTHAQLGYNPMQGWTIMDCNSSNGTKVDGVQLKPNIPSVLQNGSRLMLANVEFLVEIM